jgi:hypothetical protein
LFHSSLGATAVAISCCYASSRPGSVLEITNRRIFGKYPIITPVTPLSKSPGLRHRHEVYIQAFQRRSEEPRRYVEFCAKRFMGLLSLAHSHSHSCQKIHRTTHERNGKNKFGEPRSMFDHFIRISLVEHHHRTHRERKEAYTKSLENQVVQLRANEAMILQESKWLYSEVTALRQIVAAHGMELPSSIVPSQPGVAVDFRSHGDAFDLSIRFTDSKHKQRQIHVERLPTHIHQEHYGQPMMTRGNISSPSDGSQTISSFNRRTSTEVNQHVNATPS